MRKKMYITAAIVAVAVVVGIASRWWLGSDNCIEEKAEVLIEQHTGIDIDLSPDTPEE